MLLLLLLLWLWCPRPFAVPQGCFDGRFEGSMFVLQLSAYGLHPLRFLSGFEICCVWPGARSCCVWAGICVHHLVE
jgi:hypothetical protein